MFTKLKLNGYNSPFITYFSEVEQRTSSFSDPEYNKSLLKREASVYGKGDDKGVIYSFQLEVMFRRIRELNPHLWLIIIQANRATSLVKISEINLPADCNQDFMKFVTNALQRGHYESQDLCLGQII